MKSKISWIDCAEVCGFIGNTLLKPMTQTSHVGIDPAFWDRFPTFDNGEIQAAIESCRDYAERVGAQFDEEDDAVMEVSVEFTKLFNGPPSPAAPPWETMYQNGGTNIGFGEPTFEMRGLLRDRNLSLVSPNIQYEDHIGIEMLYLSELCYEMVEIETEDSCGSEQAKALLAEIQGYINAHPMDWIDKLVAREFEAYPEGYYVRLIKLTSAFLRWLLDQRI